MLFQTLSIKDFDAVANSVEHNWNIKVYVPNFNFKYHE